MVVPQKVKNIITKDSSNSASGFTHRITESRVSRRHVYTHVQSSIIHNIQKVEASQVSLMDEWIN